MISHLLISFFLVVCDVVDLLLYCDAVGWGLFAINNDEAFSSSMRVFTSLSYKLLLLGIGVSEEDIDG